jgi:ABC-type Zn uptake system ZnuABC Zn-binding protein ZnuA
MIEHILNRLNIYTTIPPTEAMAKVIVKIMVELLSALARVTKQIKQKRPSESILAYMRLN